MKIKTTVTQEREVEISFPFFRKDPISACTSLFAVLDEKNVLSLFKSDRMVNLSSDTIDRRSIENEVSEKYTTWEPITEAEFMSAYSEALKSLSLEPVMA